MWTMSDWSRKHASTWWGLVVLTVKTKRRTLSKKGWNQWHDAINLGMSMSSRLWCLLGLLFKSCVFFYYWDQLPPTTWCISTNINQTTDIHTLDSRFSRLSRTNWASRQTSGRMHRNRQAVPVDTWVSDSLLRSYKANRERTGPGRPSTW